jgi:hypothetical protein
MSQLILYLIMDLQRDIQAAENHERMNPENI